MRQQGSQCHHYHISSTFGLGEMAVLLHTDVRTNSYMMYYLMWHVLNMQHKEITISYFTVEVFFDARFGMLKCQFRKIKVGCLTDIAEIVRKSATLNYCQLVGNQR